VRYGVRLQSTRFPLSKLKSYFSSESNSISSSTKYKIGNPTPKEADHHALSLACCIHPFNSNRNLNLIFQIHLSNLNRNPNLNFHIHLSNPSRNPNLSLSYLIMLKTTSRFFSHVIILFYFLACRPLSEHDKLI